MRYTYLFDQEIDKDTVQGLIEALHSYEKIDLYFSTVGGEVWPMKALLSYLNSRKEDIKIFLTDAILSAGTFILTDFEGEIELAEDLGYMMFHVFDSKCYSLRKNGFCNKTYNLQLKEENKIFAEKLKRIGLNERELKKFNRGEDVYLYKKDFKRLKIGISNKQ